MTRRLSVSVSEEFLARALEQRGDVEVLRWDLASAPPRGVIDLVVPDYLAPKSRLARLAEVTTRLVQSQSIGFDGVFEVLPPGVVYANATTVHEASTAELALALVLASQRGLPDFVRAASRAEWAFSYHPSLADRTVLLFGYGGLGRAIEARLSPFDVRILRVATRGRREGSREVHGTEELPTLLPHADVVISSLPLTEATRGVINTDFLARMAPGSLLVNVGRGPVAVTEDLVSAARSGRVRLALDVVDPEPLPSHHPLWSLPNVLISPHVGGATNAMAPRVLSLIEDQIDRLVRGDSPRNVVLRT